MQENVNGKSKISKKPPEIIFEEAEINKRGEHGTNWYVHNRVLNSIENAREKLLKSNGRQGYKVYMRRCRVCGRIYRTTSRRSKKCDKCKKPYLIGTKVKKNEVE